MEKPDKIEHAKDEIRQWYSDADSYDKIKFVKELLTTMSSRELKDIKNITTKVAGRTQNKLLQWKGPVKRKHSSTEPTTPESVSTLEQSMARPDEGVGGKRSREKWLDGYGKNDIVALDVEMVRCKKTNQMLAGIVSVVDSNGKEIYGAKVKHAPDSFVVDKYTWRINRIGKYTLKDGDSIEEVKAKVEECLNGKLVIVAGGANDFVSLGLEQNQYKVFDIQSYFKRPNKQEFDNPTPVSLRDLYFYYYKIDIQRNEHSAYKDAKATLKIFNEQYGGEDLSDEVLLTDTVYLKDKEKQGLFYCSKGRDFIKKCYCC